MLGLQTGFGQILDPVKWSFSTEKVNDQEYNLKFTATIEPGWYVYSQFLEGEDGPIPTSFNFDESDHFELVGKAVENSDHRKEGHDPMFDMNIVKFAESVTFTQKIKV
ncbi:MAG: hypothetical protein D6714_03540, partial [Bacteroidetes bacterium]